MTISKQLIDGIDHLDPLPITVQKLIGKLEEEFPSPKEIAEIVELDLAITTTMLRVVNSASMRGRVEIERVGDAVMRLGIDEVLNIAMGSHLQTLVAPLEFYDLPEDELWLHGAVASFAAKEIIKACPSVDIPQSAVVASLTHDIGKLILVRYCDANPDEIMEIVDEKSISFVEAERELFGFDHAEVGAAVAEKWCFPPEIRDAIAAHHEVPLKNPTPLLDTVMLANMVTKTSGVGLGAECVNFHTDPDTLGRLGLDFNGFSRVCSEVISHVEELKANYNVSQPA